MSIDKNLEAKIDRYFESRRDEIVENIKRVVRIKSVAEIGAAVAPFGEGCINVLREGLKIAKELGLQTKNLDNYAGLIRSEEPNPAEEIALFAHLDVVEEMEGWEFSPYEPVVSDGYLIGRGVGDDKGPAIASLYMLKCAKDLGIKMKHPLMVYFGTCEEIGMNDQEYYLQHETAPKFALTPDSDFPVTNGERGMIFIRLKTSVTNGNIVDCGGGIGDATVPDSAFVVLSNKKASDLLLGEGISAEDTAQGVKISATGVKASISEPETGINAFHKLFSWLLKNDLISKGQKKVISAMCSISADCNGAGLGIPLEDEPSGKLTHVMGKVNFSEGIFKIGCKVSYPVTIDDAAMMEALRDKIEEYGLEPAFLKNVKPSYIPADEPMIVALMDTYNEATGENAKPVIIGGGTYARLLPRAVAYGMKFPNDTSPFGEHRGSFHQPDECIKVDALLKASKIYMKALIKIDSLI